MSRTPPATRDLYDMSERADQLLETADEQISELIRLLTARGETALSRPCPGREQMGSGTVAACASHTADRYQLIAAFLQAISHMPGAHAEARPGAHQIPRSPPAGGHAPPGHGEEPHDKGMHDVDYAAENVDLGGLLQRLSTGRDAFRLLAELTDEQLDTAPPAGSFRFCDGQRTLERVVSSLLKHQSHQLDAIKAALA